MALEEQIAKLEGDAFALLDELDRIDREDSVRKHRSVSHTDGIARPGPEAGLTLEPLDTPDGLDSSLSAFLLRKHTKYPGK